MASRTRGIRVPGRAARAALLCCVLGLVILMLAGCEKTTYSQRISIVAEPMNSTGLFAQVEYLRDGKVANSVHLVDGDGDGIVDGKSGPQSGGEWPVGWQWFDSMYADTVVGETAILFDGQKVVVKAAKTYEFIVGEYEVRAAA